MRKRWIKATAHLLASSGLLLAMGTASAQDIMERTIRVAITNVIQHPQGLGAQRIAEAVSKKSGGKMKVQIFAGGTLGGDAAVISSLQGGTLDMTMVSTGLLAPLSKEFVVFDLPFLLNDYREADAVLDGPVGQKLLDTLPAKGLVGFGYWDYGFRNVTNSKRPIARMEDLQGLKIRSLQIPVFIDMFNALGANAVPMPFPEVYGALENKAIDGQENPFATIEYSRLYEVQKYASTTRHVYNPAALIFSKKIWDKLSADERKILQEAVKEAIPFEREMSRDMELKSIDSLKSKGVVITDITAAERERMRDKLKPVTQKYELQAGEELIKELHGEIAKLRASK